MIISEAHGVLKGKRGFRYTVTKSNMVSIIIKANTPWEFSFILNSGTILIKHLNR